MERLKPKKKRAASRARKGAIAASVTKIVKKATSISELLTEDDQQENLRVIREAKRATHKIYDREEKKFIDVPDTKSRLAAVVLELAYREGRPIERQVQVAAKFEDLNDMLARLRQSPEALRMLSGLADDTLI